MHCGKQALHDSAAVNMRENEQEWTEFYFWYLCHAFLFKQHSDLQDIIVSNSSTLPHTPAFSPEPHVRQGSGRRHREVCGSKTRLWLLKMPQHTAGCVPWISLLLWLKPQLETAGASDTALPLICHPHAKLWLSVRSSGTLRVYAEHLRVHLSERSGALQVTDTLLQVDHVLKRKKQNPKTNTVHASNHDGAGFLPFKSAEKPHWGDWKMIELVGSMRH